MGEVVDLNPTQATDAVLKAAAGNFKDVLILGYNTEGYMDVMASIGLAPKAELLMLIENFKHALMNGVYDDDE
ncbi:hypothetical protein D3C81_1633830 [compost metagenome]